MKLAQVLGVGVCVCLAGASSALAVDYVVTDLGTLGGSASRAMAINNNNLIAGHAHVPGDTDTHAFRYVGVLQDLGALPGGTGSTAHGINIAGVVVGQSNMPGGMRHAVAIDGLSFLDLGTLGGSDSGAAAISNAGWITGASDRAGGDKHAFLAAPGGGGNLYDSVVNTPLPDDDPFGVSDTINVPDSFSISDLNVGLVVTHTYVGDLCVTLEHNATTISLILRMGDLLNDCHQGPPFGCGSDNLDIVLDDEGAGGPVEDLCVAPSPPSYIPNELLSAFDGMDAAGLWTLTVSDNAGLDTGDFGSWSLRFGESSLLDLGSLQPGGDSAGLGINSSGVVCGVTTVVGGEMHPCVFFDGIIDDLGTFGGIRGAANDINDNNIVVGYADNASGDGIAFMRPLDGPKIPLGTLGGDWSMATAINEVNTIVGYSTIVGGSDTTHAFVYCGGMVDIHPAGFAASEAHGINDWGVIVGVGYDNGGTPHAIRWEPAPLTITSSNPPEGAIDAAQPSNPDGSNPSGWNSVQITFNNAGCGLTPGDFTVSVPQGCGPTPNITSVDVNGQTATLQLGNRITRGTWTTFTHNASGSSTTLGWLPGDVSGDGTSAPGDILLLIDSLNGVVDPPLDPWQCDADRSGQCNPADILRTIDLLNGAQTYNAWNLVSICE